VVVHYIAEFLCTERRLVRSFARGFCARWRRGPCLSRQGYITGGSASGRVEAVDLDAFAAGAGHDEPHDLVALLDAFNGRMGRNGPAFAVSVHACARVRAREAVRGASSRERLECIDR